MLTLARFVSGACSARLLALTLASGLLLGGRNESPARPATDAASEKLVAAFAAQGIHFDLEHGLCALPVRVLVRDDLLEYVLVNERGAAHESMFSSDVRPSDLNAALLALGARPGRNAAWVKRDPPPTEAEMRDGVGAYEVKPPAGDGFYAYVAWKVGDETYFQRLEDLILDRMTGQTMRRHKWVYLGSRLVRAREGSPDEAFAADLEGNLVNLALFEQGNTLVTAALPECLRQTIWQTNFWLVPPQGSTVEFVFARERLATPPASLASRLPVVASTNADGR